MKKLTCSICGAIYSYEEEHLIYRDKDEKNCECCGNTLISWNGSKIPTHFKLIKDGVKKSNDTFCE